MSPFYWALIAAVLWGVSPLLEKTGLKNADPLAGLFARSMGVVLGTIVLGLSIAGLEEKIRAMGLKSFLLIGCGGLIASIIAQIAFYQALKNGELGRVTAVAGAYPLIAFILGVVFLGEGLSAIKISGVVLVVTGVLLLRL